jgi:hypothetical protein
MAEKVHEKNKVSFKAKHCKLRLCNGRRKLKKIFTLLKRK